MLNSSVEKNILMFFRRQELRELRLIQKESNRAQAVLNTKLETQRDQMHRRFDQEMNVSSDVLTQSWGTNLTRVRRKTSTRFRPKRNIMMWSWRTWRNTRNRL